MIAPAPASMNASARLSASSPHPGASSLSALRRASDHELLRHRGGLAGPDLLAERRDAFELLLALVGMLELGPGACRTASSAPHRPCLRRSPGDRACRRRRSEASSSRRPAGHRVLGGEVEPSSDQPLARGDGLDVGFALGVRISFATFNFVRPVAEQPGEVADVRGDRRRLARSAWGITAAGRSRGGLHPVPQEHLDALLKDQRVFNQSSKERLYREFQVFLRDHWSENQFVTPLHME